MELCRAESKGRCMLQEFDLTQQFTVNCLCHKLSQLWVLSKNIGEDEHCLLEYFSDNSIKSFVGSILLQKSTLSLLALCSKSVVMLVGILSKDVVRLPNILNWTLLTPLVWLFIMSKNQYDANKITKLFSHALIFFWHYKDSKHSKSTYWVIWLHLLDGNHSPFSPVSASILATGPRPNWL